MINKHKNTLILIIIRDIFNTNKLSMLLFCSTLLSAILVVLITYKTRLLTVQREQLILECNQLDNEWRNLILEENVLGDHNRVGNIAIKKLQMQYVDPLKERILIKNK
ncbi:Cell division protein FtsL [Candidatus Profftia lariciata]|uniref:cell division protein FtsL n=1 Tax=Candidatus Profftia lariciata TaxID=1987921 RepID=UPI001D00FC59|nr:cell division protein FtsL [Candidatus Profftia lariciata]UDG81384.1 Cell division protein FtsL [Candidatus Profftia lariciata]